MTVPVLGVDGTPLVDHPVIAAERAARLADELAALCDHLLAVLAWQDAALGLVHTSDDDEESAGCVKAARRIADRATATVALLRDSLGEQHVSCDELAGQLRRLLPAPEDPDASEPIWAMNELKDDPQGGDQQ